jgi:hypothetical protein
VPLATSKEEPPAMTEQTRKRILEELNAGQLGFEEAMQMLKGGTEWDAKN